MDIATMTAINNMNMLTTMTALQAANSIIVFNKNGEESKDMDGTMLMGYIGKECVVSLFNEVGAIKGKFMDADNCWVKVETKKGTQLINRNMIRNITFENK